MKYYMVNYLNREVIRIIIKGLSTYCVFLTDKKIHEKPEVE